MNSSQEVQYVGYRQLGHRIGGRFGCEGHHDPALPARFDVHTIQPDTDAGNYLQVLRPFDNFLRVRLRAGDYPVRVAHQLGHFRGLKPPAVWIVAYLAAA